MSEAPKKILYHKKKHVFGWETEETISYIRADIVDELVEALKAILGFAYAEHDGELLTIQEAKAALAKLEESHD